MGFLEDLIEIFGGKRQAPQPRQSPIYSPIQLPNPLLQYKAPMPQAGFNPQISFRPLSIPFPSFLPQYTLPDFNFTSMQPAKAVPGKQIVSAGEAKKLIDSGYYAKFRGAWASRTVTWGMLAVGITDAELKRTSQSVLNEAQRTAQTVDIAASVWGVSTISGTGARGSAMRFPGGANSAAKSNHYLGKAIDIRPPVNMSAKAAHDKLLNSKRLPGDLGWNQYSNFVHLSNGPNPANAGKRFSWTYTPSGSPTSYKTIGA
jgi:hypothetical protein